MESLARALREKDLPARYDRLAAFARAHAKTAPGQRAALALGFRDYNKQRYPQARQWLAIARKDSVLEEYAVYWDALALRALGKDAQALELLEAHRRRYPESVMAPQVVQSLAWAALLAGEPSRGLAALDAFADTPVHADLLLLRARTYERLDRDRDAAADYLTLVYDFPLLPAADAADERLKVLRRILPASALAIAPERKVSRAESLFTARKWKEARAEYDALLDELTAAARERAQLRIAQCRVRLGAAPTVVAGLKFLDSEVDAERLHVLAHIYRQRKQEAPLVEAVEQSASRYPASPWTEESLFVGGNYYWLNLNRALAADYYKRVLDSFPAGKNALNAHWRIAWLAYLERRAGVAAQFEDHLRRFPGSPYTPNAIYWLARTAEREGNIPHARTFYLKLLDRFPQTYFGLRAGERFRAVGSGPTNGSDVLALIPPVAPLPSLNDSVPSDARPRWQRAQALRSIAFDASAELELRAAYTATPSPRLLLEAAKAALDADRFLPAIAAARQVVPQLEARRWGDVPGEVWRTAYPVAYESFIEKYSARVGLDSALVAGLIRQESLFQKDAISRAGAIGLMQVLPSTGRQLARGEKLRYARSRLMDPEYNIRLGTVYLRDIFKQFGSTEAVLAAYNAGEDRVILWQAERAFEEPAEFVESIPITETRDYVQIVTRNAEIYRRLYSKSNGKKP